MHEAGCAARRTMAVGRSNFVLTGYNVVRLTLAALGILSPIAAAAAAQSIPDLAILGNSARLMRARRR